MTDLIEPSCHSIALPPPRVPISVRPAVLDDLPFIDALQKKHHKQLAFFNKPTLEGKIGLGHVLVAEVVGGGQWAEGSWDKVGGGRSAEGSGEAVLPTVDCPLPTSVGYLIGNDRYQHRDELGVIFQLAVAAEYRRSLVAAHLLQAQFERSAYGCRLYCCWCAQDIEGNRFWESMGFSPIAYRAGSEKKKRVHIFWQKRIREGDTTTPWWFPSETRGGLMDASRIALPIPPGMSWKDELPVLRPRAAVEEDASLPVVAESSRERHRALPGPAKKKEVPAQKALGGLWFDGRASAPRTPVRFSRPGEVPRVGPVEPVQAAREQKPVKPKRIKKADPALAARARELRDRWLERLNANPMARLGKYDLRRGIERREPVERPMIEERRQLSLAA